MAVGSLALLANSVPKIRGTDIQAFIASRQQAEGLFSGFGGIEEPHPSEILERHSEVGRRMGELYDVMLRTDAMIAGLWEKRWKAVLGLPYSIIPADNTPRAQEIADACLRAIEGVKNLEVNLEHQLGGILRGRAFDEIQWKVETIGPLAGKIVPATVTDRPMWRFGFKFGSDAICVRGLNGLLTQAPPYRFLSLQHGTKDSPWGAALLDRLYWCYWLSLHGWKYFGVAVEKWAQPTPIGKYERNVGTGTDAESANQAQIDLVMAALRDIQTEYGIAIPKDFEIGLLESTRSGTVSYESFIGLLDRAKALVMLGEVDTSGLAKGPGSFAKSRVSDDVRIETIAMDATELANSLTDDYIRPFVAVNYGLAEPVPYWEFDVEEAEDRAQRRAGAEAVLTRGLPLPASYYYRVNQAPQPKPGEPVVTGPFTQTPTPHVAAPQPDVASVELIH